MSKTPTKADRLAAEKRKTQRLLEKVGYLKAKREYGKSLRPSFPDLSTDDHRTRYPSQMGVGSHQNPPPAAHHPDAKQFPVGLNHKQGYSLVTGADDLSYLGGKKT